MRLVAVRLVAVAVVAAVAVADDDCVAASDDWHKGSHEAKDCAWVSESPSRRCGKSSADGVVARDACAACGACGCADSSSWYAKKSKKTCGWIGKNPGRCKKKDADGVRAREEAGVSGFPSSPYLQ